MEVLWKDRRREVFLAGLHDSQLMDINRIQDAYPVDYSEIMGPDGLVSGLRDCLHADNNLGRCHANVLRGRLHVVMENVKEQAQASLANERYNLSDVELALQLDPEEPAPRPTSAHAAWEIRELRRHHFLTRFRLSEIADLDQLMLPHGFNGLAVGLFYTLDKRQPQGASVIVTPHASYVRNTPPFNWGMPRD